MAEKKPSKTEIVVFSVTRDTQCSECGTELWSGDFLKKEDDGVFCMTCADLGHLVYLPRGDAALTRRANKYSSLHAVVVRFSRARDRYERQGILVEEAALQKAEAECVSDADVRAQRREIDSLKREHLDAEYMAEFAQQILVHYPSCPAEETRIIAEHACRKHSGRVGRSAAAKAFDSDAIALAVVAHVRHVHTNYDELLMKGWDRREAREAIASQVQEVLEQWR